MVWDRPARISCCRGLGMFFLFPGAERSVAFPNLRGQPAADQCSANGKESHAGPQVICSSR